MYIFHILSNLFIKLYLIQPLTYPFYPPYVSISSPQPLNLFYKPVARESYCIAFSPFRFVTVFSASILHWIAAEKVNTPVKKRFSPQEFGKSREKRDFYIALPKKIFTLHYAILCIPMDLLWIIFASRYIRIVYITETFPCCISHATLFSISTIFSPSLFSFLSAILFSISIYCGFAPFYHYAALVVPFCTWLCFFLFSFALLM